MIRTVVCILSLSLCVLTFSCRQETGSTDNRELKELEQKWVKHINAGRMEEVAEFTTPFYLQARARNDSLSVAYSGAHLAQCYIVLEDRDSVSHYLQAVRPYIDRVNEPKIGILYYNVLGGYHLKYSLDYPKALEAFLNGYNHARTGGSDKGMVTMLCNIVYIYYILGDKHGSQFALEAMEIACRNKTDVVSRAYASLALAEMYCLDEEYGKALACLDETDRISTDVGLGFLNTHAGVVRADVFLGTDDLPAAEAAYKKALRYADITEPSIASLAYMRYGDLMREKGDSGKALTLYEKALELSTTYGDLEFRGDILLALLRLHSDLGNYAEMAACYRTYRVLLDSVGQRDSERDFNHLVLTNRQLEKNNEIQAGKLALQRVNRSRAILVGILVLILLVSAFAFALYRRKMKTYDALVIRHKSYRRTLELSERVKDEQLRSERELIGRLRSELDEANRRLSKVHAEKVETEDENRKEEEDTARMLLPLFTQIDTLMREEKYYQHKDISLEALSDALNTNRTYVSQAINHFAGMSFTGYINKYRIEEAARILSDPEADVLMKQLADRLGYSSDTVFSRVFQREMGLSPRNFRKAALNVE